MKTLFIFIPAFVVCLSSAQAQKCNEVLMPLSPELEALEQRAKFALMLDGFMDRQASEILIEAIYLMNNDQREEAMERLKDPAFENTGSVYKEIIQDFKSFTEVSNASN